ncbi:MAG: threonine synthase [Nitrospirae bacterium CG_4_10_14_0_8_um_filter_41_23]|nr:threonine synthase [Nitrospirota bacterium]OIP58952.1 MAG: threonine synthase [Nitrospirae bacterium CG2_30_41_42]PIQ94141.1 MAG: threonine synthase [Nitrospirae bacterium CG11_big_fil_rev_8_21_14_0_20_41_14]PIV43151.1 MAG: threonine synthase [Nitrospirae bacterium CG02_land_8_20_14_3_00_41_53]PIW87823.1 MAG: threonine synthase [Nitrospirae bacterium CG_4_8_14_3_um_filter_41_47]PIY87677.1 MAG: threonine synthase [Nitrospirae bacterium CG_4_10_14_0_8_um_filter_41_23]PJA78869.1 MAG: threonin
MGYVKDLKCRECGREYPVAPVYVCEFCFGPLEVVYDYKSIKKVLTRKVIERREKNLWRYKELLPIDGEPLVGLNSGYTPLLKADNLAKEFGVKELYIKDDTVTHPTLSFKDRVVAIALTKAREFGFDTVACASTGNLAHSVSAQGAKAGFKRFIFIPATLEASKIVASLIYEPNLIAVNGNYDDVNRLCSEIANKYRWAFVNINIRPFYAEGSKTHGFEIIEQLGWKAPDNVIIPCASGSLLTKIWKSFKEFKEIGIIKELSTKVFASQATGCSPISTAIKQGTDVIRPVKPDTIAKSLAIGNPADGYYATQVVNETGGWGEDVSDQEIIDGIKLLARAEGIFAETAGGVTVAVTKKLIESGKIGRDETTVICVTGNGLKTQEALNGQTISPYYIKPNIGSFEEVLQKIRRGGK